MKALRAVLALVFLVPGVVLAQMATTSLRGTVKDASGAVVPNATITLTDNAKGTVLKATANAVGEYQFAQISPAKYTITVSAAGFGDQAKIAELLVNQPATIDFSLSVQALAVTVDVSAEAQTLNTTDATIGNSVSNAVIQSLPMEGRNVPDLLSLQPGVLYLGRQIDQNMDSRSGSVAGARSDQTNVTLDGLDDNDQQNGFAFQGVLRSTLDSTEEFRVTTTGSNADAGRSSGAQVSLVTKAGTNKFHGALYEYFRPSNTVANDWFNKAGELSTGEPNVPGKLIRNTFGGSLGGPIKKDKLFFFFNYEGQRTAENQEVTQTVPTKSYREGMLSYQYCKDASDTVCNSVKTLQPADVAAMDATCAANGVCPWGPGADPFVLQTFSQYPLPNGNTTGDGLNLASFSFSSPHPGTLNTSIAKLDYQINDKHHLFVRGNLQKDTQAGTEQFPGQPASSEYIDNSKGLAAGETWSITPSLVNDVRYGYIRQGFSSSGIGHGDYTTFRFISQPVAETRSDKVDVPVNNLVDTLSWTKASHSFSFGGNWRLIHNNRGSDANSFNNATTNPYWYGNAPDPADLGGGTPTFSDGFANSFQIAYGNLIGGIPEASGVYNYAVDRGAASGSLLPDGAFINRHFKANEFEYFLQDSWRARPNLTITYGIRHTILQTPYEENGQEIAPTVDTHAWFMQRGVAASEGRVYEPLLSFAPAGPANHRPGLWQKQKANIAPRLAIAYSPDAKTSIRAGFGLYFDHYGEGIVNTFDQNGSFGLSTSLSTPAGVYDTDTAPRFTGINNIVTNSQCVQKTKVTYPYEPPGDANCGFAITWGADNHLKTPYSEAIDLSVQRELPGGFTVEAAYVGRLGRHLLQALDLAEPVDFVDSKTGVDYFHAGAQLSRLSDLHHGNPGATVQPIPYFEDVFPQMAGYDYPGESATQAIYTNEWAPYRYNYGETTSLADLDFYCYYGCPNGTQFWQSQFSSLYAWSSIGMSSYNAGQFIVRHPMGHGLQFDFSYTLSKSIDMGSDTERASEITANNSFSSILNSWQPSLNRAVSDFDTRHLITFDWVYKLPVGRGQAALGNAGRLVDTLLGGWQWSGLNRWTSGLPFGIFEPGWSTNWQLESYGVTTAKVKVRKHLEGGTPVAFDNAAAINNGIKDGGTPVRLPYPGEAGERNNFRGDGYFDIDSSLTKNFKITENQNLRFAWDVFNVTNSVRFDTNPNFSLNTQISQSTLGAYSAVLTLPRVMQFSLRYDF
jgi:hypothetical protein